MVVAKLIVYIQGESKKWDLAFAFITQAKIGPCERLICQIKGLDEPDRAVLVSFKNFYLLMRYFEKTGQK